MQVETIYFVERKSKEDVLYGDILEWTISLSEKHTQSAKDNLEKTTTDNDSYYVVRSMIITD